MTRKKKFFLNTSTALIKQIVSLICGFVLPRYILLYYGSGINGLVTSVTQFLGFISFLEMGIGPVIQSNLYKPLADKNDDEISKIVSSSEKFFRRIATIFLGYIVVLIIIFPIFINGEYGFWFTGSLLIIIAISTFAQYYFGITYQLLLNADQRSYVQMTMQIVTILLNTVVSVLLMKLGFSIQVVKLSTAIIYLLRPIGQSIYVHHHYDINKEIKYTGEPIKQKWNGFAQHLAAVVVQNTDVAILSVMSTLTNVSIYSVYYNVVYGINNTVLTMVTGLESLWGNMLAKKEMGKLRETFETVESIMHMGCTFLFSATAILIVPFIKVYTDGITDANYIAPVFGAMLTAAYGIQCLRVPYFRIIKAAGHYKQTQKGAIIQMIVNLTVSIILVYKLGLVGVAVGTLVCMLYHTTYFAWYLRKNILNRKFIFYIKHMLLDAVAVVICALCCQFFEMGSVTYVAWIILAVKVAVVCLVVCCGLNMIFYKNKIIGVLKLLKK